MCVGRAGATGQAQGKLHYSGVASDGGDGREHAEATACGTHDWQLEDSFVVPVCSTLPSYFADILRYFVTATLRPHMAQMPVDTNCSKAGERVQTLCVCVDQSKRRVLPF